MKICLVNMQIAWKNKKENLRLINDHIKHALKIDSNIDTIVFPETSCTGYILEESANKLAEDKNEYCVKEIKKLAKKYAINIIAGFIEQSKNKKPFNSAFVANKKGKLAAIYHKNHLFSQASEEKYYSPGKELTLFNLDGWTCGLAICMDIRYPRLFEILADNDAELIFVPANWIKGENKFQMLKFLTKTRAVENQIYCAMVDRFGKDPNTQYTGSWMLADPLGNDVSVTYDKIYHIGEIKKQKIKAVRKMIPLKLSFKSDYKINKLI